jgi:hypothetical protein
MTGAQVPAAPEDPRGGRWEFLRDVVIFQIKVGLEALRDLVLFPVSVLAAVGDLISGSLGPDNAFHRVLEVGRRSDRWLNLFGEHDRKDADEAADAQTIDAMLGEVERLLVDQYEQGGVTATAKSAIDRSLDAISRGSGKPPE